MSRSAFQDPDELRRESATLRRKVFHTVAGLEDNILWERMLRMPVIDGAVPPLPLSPGLAGRARTSPASTAFSWPEIRWEWPARAVT